MKSDEELMRDYQEGSEEAFTVLYEKYSSLVYGYTFKRLRESEAQDFYQTVWRQLHEKRHLYKDQPFLPWFFVMMRHLLIDEYRLLGRKNIKAIETELKEMLHPERNEENDLEEILLKLPEDARDLVRKHYLEEISYEELERDTGMSQTTLRQRLSRAMRALKANL